MENISEKYIQMKKNKKTFLGETFWTLEVEEISLFDFSLFLLF